MSKLKEVCPACKCYPGQKHTYIQGKCLLAAPLESEKKWPDDFKGFGIHVKW